MGFSASELIRKIEERLWAMLVQCTQVSKWGTRVWCAHTYGSQTGDQRGTKGGPGAHRCPHSLTGTVIELSSRTLGPCARCKVRVPTV